MQKINSHNVFMSLPTCLIHCILSDWVETVSVIRLDFALVGKKSFQLHLHDILQSGEFCLKEVKPTEGMYFRRGPSSSNNLCFMMLNWLLVRNVKALSLEVLADCAEDCLGNFLQRFGQYVRRACLHAPNHIPSLEKYCRNLTAFVAYGSHAQNGCLRILSTNSNLEQLHLEGECWQMPESSYPMILRKLRQLRWSTTYGFGSALVSVAKAAPNLVQLALSTNSNLYCTHTGPIIIEMAHACPNLRTFSCKQLPIGPRDNSLKRFFVTCSAIVNLDVSMHAELSDAVLIDALEVLVDLKCLNLIGCCLLTDRTLEFLAHHYASTLQILYLGHQDTYTAPRIARLRAQCTHLHTFHYFVEVDAWQQQQMSLVEACQRATIVDLKDEQMLPLVLQHCHQMQIMAVTFSHYNNDLVRLTVEQLMEVVERCPQLRRVVFEQSVFGVREDDVDYSAVRERYPNVHITTDMTMFDFDMLEIPV